MAVLLIAEHNNKELKPFTLNAVTAASQIDTEVHAVIIGKDCEEGAKALSQLPLVKKVIHVEAAHYENFVAENFAPVIVKLADKTDLTLAVGHVERHNPVVYYAKNAIDEGKWGEIITLTSKRVSNFPERITDVGVLFDLCIHDIDISNYLSNSKVNSVYALGGKKRPRTKIILIYVYHMIQD